MTKADNHGKFCTHAVTSRRFQSAYVILSGAKDLQFENDCDCRFFVVPRQCIGTPQNDKCGSGAAATGRIRGCVPNDTRRGITTSSAPCK